VCWTRNGHCWDTGWTACIRHLANWLLRFRVCPETRTQAVCQLQLAYRQFQTFRKMDIVTEMETSISVEERPETMN
jgi:hypothetical protein